MLSSGSTLSTPSHSTTDPADFPSTSGEHERGTLHRLSGVSVVTEWPHGSFVENLATKHDGHLIVTVYSTNEVYEIDPTLSAFNRTLIATLPSGPSGICELDFNHFYISAGSLGQRHTWSIYCVSLHHGLISSSSYEKIVDIDSALFLNGLCVLSYENGTLLSVDSMLGQIFKINIHTKQVELWYENDLLKKRSHDPQIPGVNGIRRCSIDGSVYLSNTDRAILLRLAVDPFDYRPKGKLETIARNIVCDDFTIDRLGAIYATTHIHNSLMRLTPVKDGEYLREDIATLTEGLAGSTSCVFGRTYQDRTRYGSINNAIRKRGGKRIKIDHIIFMFDQRKKNISFSIDLPLLILIFTMIRQFCLYYITKTNYFYKTYTQTTPIFTVLSIYQLVVFESHQKSRQFYLLKESLVGPE
jgi:hypothetical protein